MQRFMSWKPKGYKFDDKQLIRALFSSSTDESRLLDAAAAGEIDIYSENKNWNAVLWLVMNTLKTRDGPIYTGSELGELKNCLPIIWIK